MAEALYNASGLGLPIVMTVANRAIGSPINIWNDHSDAMSQRDSGWIQLYAESNQEALDLHVQAFRLAEELSLPVMVCMDGFVLTHAHERVDVPTAGAGRRLPAAVRAAPGARSRRPGDDRRDGRARGVHRGPLPHARQADAGARRDPAIARRVRRGIRARRPAGSCAAYRTEDAETRRRRARLGRSARSRTSSTSCASAASAIGALARHVLPPVAAGRGARRAGRRASASSSSRRPSRSAWAGSSARTCAWRWRACRCDVHDVVAGLGGRPVTSASLHRLLDDALAGRLGRLTFLDLRLGPRRARAAARARARRSGPHAENMLRDLGIVAGGQPRAGCPTSRSSTTSRARSWSATACSTPTSEPCSPTRGARTR